MNVAVEIFKIKLSKSNIKVWSPRVIHIYPPNADYKIVIRRELMKSLLRAAGLFLKNLDEDPEYVEKYLRKSNLTITIYAYKTGARTFEAVRLEFSRGGSSGNNIMQIIKDIVDSMGFNYIDYGVNNGLFFVKTDNGRVEGKGIMLSVDRGVAVYVEIFNSIYIKFNPYIAFTVGDGAGIIVFKRSKTMVNWVIGTNPYSDVERAFERALINERITWSDVSKTVSAYIVSADVQRVDSYVRGYIPRRYIGMYNRLVAKYRASLAALAPIVAGARVNTELMKNSSYEAQRLNGRLWMALLRPII